MSKKEFWTRFSIYVALGAVIPFAFLTWRFNLFSKVNKLSIGGWGIIAIIVLAVFFISMIKAIRRGLPFSFGAQVLTVICKVSIPIMVVLVCANFFRDIMEQVAQFLGVLFVCETAAGIVNPIPQWSNENQIKEEEGRIKKLLNSLGIGNKGEDKQ